MSVRQLVLRGLIHYWRTNAAVVAGVATAVAVLGGALLVGDSVRGSLRDLVLERIGRTSHVVAGAGFFRERLSEELGDDVAAFDAAAPLIILPGVVSEPAGARRAGQVRVYGVDDRFWRFHGRSVDGPAEGDVLLSPALAGELGVAEGDTVLVRVERPSAIPLESLHGRKDDLAALEVGKVRLWAVEPGGRGEEFYLCIRAEDVTLEIGAQPGSSARNHLAGTVTDVRPAGPVSRVTVDCGFALTALVTRQAAQDLALQPGTPVTATVKASAVHLIPR